jgi:hypothetical protein
MRKNVRALQGLRLFSTIAMTLIALQTPSNAATISYSDNVVYPGLGSSSPQAFSLSAFNPNLGTLNSISLTISQIDQIFLRLTNPTARAQSGQYGVSFQNVACTQSSYCGNEVSGVTTPVYTVPRKSTVELTYLIDSGTVAFSGPGTAYAPPPDEFTGVNGQVPLTLTSTTITSSFFGCSIAPVGACPTVDALSVQLDTTLTVTYVYTPVPEPISPATPVLFGAAFLGVAKMLKSSPNQE